MPDVQVLATTLLTLGLCTAAPMPTGGKDPKQGNVLEPAVTGLGAGIAQKDVDLVSAGATIVQKDAVLESAPHVDSLANTCSMYVDRWGPSAWSSFTHSASQACEMWSKEDKTGALRDNRTLKEACATTWAATNCAKMCCEQGFPTPSIMHPGMQHVNAASRSHDRVHSAPAPRSSSLAS